MKKKPEYITANKAFRCITILTVIYVINILMGVILGFCLGGHIF